MTGTASGGPRQELLEALDLAKMIQASHRVDVRFGNKAGKPALKAANQRVKELEALLRAAPAARKEG